MSDELRSEYDLSKLKWGVRGRYAKRFKKGTNLGECRARPALPFIRATPAVASCTTDFHRIY